MSASDKIFAGSIPKIYDDFLVPLIFEGFGEDLARRVASFSPAAVLAAHNASHSDALINIGRIPPSSHHHR